MKKIFRERPLLIIMSLLVTAGLIGGGFAYADQYDAQIQKLQDQNVTNQSLADKYANQAQNYQDAVNKIQQTINALQSNIVATQQRIVKLQNQIDDAQKKIDYNRHLLAKSILALYQNGQISTFEILASSNDISDFVNKEQYQTAVQDKVKDTFDRITALKVSLQEKQRQLQGTVATLKQQQSEQVKAQAKQNQLLAYSKSQQDSFNQKVEANNSEIASLRAAQQAANQSLLGKGTLSYSGSCGGGYPGTASGPYGSWGCNFYKDNTLDNWGMYNRECVSYTAFKVYQTFGYSPFGFGDANQWPGSARAAGFTVSSTPRVHSVAIWPTASAWGHAMWVEGVNGNSTVTVSQYNFSFDGNYSMMTISTSGLEFIYFN